MDISALSYLKGSWQATRPVRFNGHEFYKGVIYPVLDAKETDDGVGLVEIEAWPYGPKIWMCAKFLCGYFELID
jgi:hypothetical protein